MRFTRVVALVLPLGVLTACSGAAESDSSGAAGPDRPVLSISAIPDQDPSELAAREERLAAYLRSALDVEVEYVPVTDYAASVSLFRAGDLDLVFYGGLTGVQARLQTPDATLLAQRDIDAGFRSVFIANAGAGIAPVDDVAGLSSFEGRRFTFGSESSTSGRLMPEYFLDEAGVDTRTELDGEPGFSGSHDKTIDLVEAGSYEGGALNVQVWEARKEAGTVDLDKVVEVFTTPTYHDYHWISGPQVDERFGDGFTEELREALLDLDGSSDEEQQVLEGYGAAGIVPTEASNYDQIEEIGRTLGLAS
jgi:phosphonate transport system substrate-binding protein